MSEISTADMLETMDEAFAVWSGGGFYRPEGDESTAMPEWEAIRAALLERDALKAEVEQLKQQSDVYFYDCEFGDPRLTKEDCLTPIAKYLLGLKAERDEWRNKAMFQQGRADEAIAIAKPSAEPNYAKGVKVTREWVLQATIMLYETHRGEMTEMLLSLLKSIGVVVADEEAK